jgi:hypothetical protein
MGEAGYMVFISVMTKEKTGLFNVVGLSLQGLQIQ